MITNIVNFFFGETKLRPEALPIRFSKFDGVPVSARGKYIRFNNSGSQRAYACMSMYADIRRSESISVNLPRGAIGICTKVNGLSLVVAFDSKPEADKYPRKNPMSCSYCVTIFPLNDGRWELEV